jgi:hypothetical protein
MAITRAEGVLRMFIDGVQLTNNNASYTPGPNGQALLIGASTPNWGNFHFNGYIDEFRLVVGTAVYTADFTPPAAPFTY